MRTVRTSGVSATFPATNFLNGRSQFSILSKRTCAPLVEATDAEAMSFTLADVCICESRTETPFAVPLGGRLERMD